MSSDKQAAIDIFTRLYDKNQIIKEILNNPGLKFYRKIHEVLKSNLLTGDDEEFIRRKNKSFAQGGFSDDEWKDIFTRVTNPKTSTTTVFAAPAGTTKEEESKEEALKKETKEEKPLLDHYKNVPSGTHVRIDVRATSFCPGFHIGAPSLGKR
ncbi:MAG: hypothetical protein ACXADW_24470, partial [Candidatus Hodarchaeales archaeon]